MSPNAKQSRQIPLTAFMFEHREAIIMLIVDGRSPTVRHASRTCRVALDWLFDQIFLDPMILVTYVHTRNPLADDS